MQTLAADVTAWNISKNPPLASESGDRNREQATRGNQDYRLHARAGRPRLHAVASVVRRRRDKVERPGSGDVTRTQLRDIPDVDALYFTMLNSNNKSLTLDTSRKTRKCLRSLLKTM